MTVHKLDQAAPGPRAVGGGRTIDLDKLAMAAAGSNAFDLAERLEGRAALAVRVARLLVASMPAHLSGGLAVAWISAAMASRGFSPAEIRQALPSAGLPVGRVRPGRGKSAPEAGRRQEPLASVNNSPEVRR